MVCLIHREQEDKLAALRSGNYCIVHTCLCSYPSIPLVPLFVSDGINLCDHLGEGNSEKNLLLTDISAT